MAEGAGKRKRSQKRFAVSRLTLTIVLANLIGLIILLVGSFGVTQYRDGLVQAKLEGVRAQAQLIADVLAQTAVNDEACEPAEVGAATDATQSYLCARSLREDYVREVFNRVWDSFEGRVRVFNAPAFDSDPAVANAASLLLEDVVLRQDSILVEDLPPISGADAESALWTIMQTADKATRAFMTGGFRKTAAKRSLEEELNEALDASPFADSRGAASVRIDENGRLVASVSVPIRKVQAIYGVVTAESSGIDELVADARLAILPFFGLAIAATILSSLLLTAFIAQPIRQLAIAADKVREGISSAGRARIPDLTNRGDEIGELSASLKSMTQATYDRIEAIESFASDVAHELKNPLTSIRSATETLEIARSEEAQAKLMSVIKKDVARMDRLITDISNASRLDAELAREAREAVDLRKLLSDIVELYRATAKENQAQVAFDNSGTPVYLVGNGGALSQIFRNLIDNARSFSPPDGKVVVVLDGGTERDRWARVFVEDDGPGVPEDAQEKIFDRFYTKRPAGAAFGNNSGLGLAISRQIAESHGGRLRVENRIDESGAVKGARFIVELPLV